MGNCWCGTNTTMNYTSRFPYTKQALRFLDGVQQGQDSLLETRLIFGTFCFSVIKEHLVVEKRIKTILIYFMINELIISSYICDECILAKITCFYFLVCTCRLVF